MHLPVRIKKILFAALLLLCLTPWIGPPLALLLGTLTALILGETFDKKIISGATHWLLKSAVVGLGFGMNFFVAIQAGKTGFVFSLISIICTLLLGFYLAKVLVIDKKTAMLISSGTAICGGSAIAAISPIIKANEHQISIALGTVFILNSVALFLFPFVGHLLHLSQTQFGYWSAIAIHDTSSVVGAASTYGRHALEIATSVKLGRALWIIPLSLLASRFYSSGTQKISIPYFIMLFIGAMIVNTFIPGFDTISGWIVPLAKKSLTLTLFLIGSGLTADVLKKVGVRPLAKGVILWIFIACGSLWMVLYSL